MSAENTRSKLQRTPKPVVQPDTVASHQQKMLNALIRERVLHALGKPPNLLSVLVRPLWEGFYRVNVLIGTDPACAKVLHSYFVRADGDGNVLSAIPELHRSY